MTHAKANNLWDATNRQPAAAPPTAGAFAAGHRAGMEWARRVSRDPARRLAIARRISRETTLATTPIYARQTRLH